MTRVRLNNQPLTLTPAAVIGVGGEATVYSHRDLALKLFHRPHKRADEHSRRRYRHKLEKLSGFPKGLPPEVVAPQELLRDDKGRVVGYAMQRVESAEPWARLSRRQWREGVVDNDGVMVLFRKLATLLRALHRRAVVVGDLNDYNLLFRNSDLWLIDADSMQFGRYACSVAHERFLDPQLYGVDLLDRPVFSPLTDWYSFAVMLFEALLYVHPYGGVHPTSRTLLRRADAGISVFHPQVRYPRTALPWQSLPGPLLKRFESIFSGAERLPFDDRILSIDWQRCSGCGLSHARRRCPGCLVQPASTPIAAQSEANGRCLARPKFRTDGRILVAAMCDRLRYLVEKDGIVQDDRGTTVFHGRLRPGMRLMLAGELTWIGKGDRLLAVEAGEIMDQRRCDQLDGLPLANTGPGGCYWIADNQLQCDGHPHRLGPVIGGHTWFQVGPELGFLFYRAGELSFSFTFDPRRPGLRPVKMPPISGRVVEAKCWFDPSDNTRLLLELWRQELGRDVHELFVIRDAALVASHRYNNADTADGLAVPPMTDKLLIANYLLCATDSGLVGLRIDEMNGTISASETFTDTAPYVDRETRLIRAPGGAVYAVGRQAIYTLNYL